MCTTKQFSLVKILLLENLMLRLFHPSLSSCSKLSVTGDTAKYLVLTLQRLCTFTLSLNQPKHPIHAKCIKERRELRQDLSEGEFNSTSKTRSTYNFATSSCQADELNSHDFVEQDRAHCLKLHGKLLNLEGLGNLFAPGWQFMSEYFKFNP